MKEIESETEGWKPAGFMSKASGISIRADGTASIVASSISTGALTITSPTYTSATTNPEPEPKPVEHVLLPQKAPRRVLVAFLDEEGNHEPFWAAFLEPREVDLDLNPQFPEDATLSLRLSLVKRFEQ